MTLTRAPLRPELGNLPSRLQRLPIDARGYPVPWFVAWVDGVPEFRAMDRGKWWRAIRERRCWVCGDALGRYLSFVIGPMCGVNGTTSEPACHHECAVWSARHCPFLSRPHMVRREDAIINNASLMADTAGIALARNPAVAVVWTTEIFRLFDDGAGRALIQLGNPDRVEWFTKGRPATRAEVIAALEAGLPALVAVAEEDERRAPGALSELTRRSHTFAAWYPPALSE